MQLKYEMMELGWIKFKAKCIDNQTFETIRIISKACENANSSVPCPGILTQWFCSGTKECTSWLILFLQQRQENPMQVVLRQYEKYFSILLLWILAHFHRTSCHILKVIFSFFLSCIYLFTHGSSCQNFYLFIILRRKGHLSGPDS